MTTPKNTSLTRSAISLFVVSLLAGHAQGTNADVETGPPWATPAPWPAKVEIASPDPVLGNAEVYENWAYTESFARRFSNLSVAKANKDMPPGLQAVVFRSYKESSGPGFYACAMDMYINNSITPVDAGPQDLKRRALDVGRTKTGTSLRRLMPIQAADQVGKAKQDALLASRRMRYDPVVFLDGVLDAQYSVIGGDYRPNALPGLHLITLDTNVFCKMAWSARAGQRYIVSLLGNDPYQYQQIVNEAYRNPTPDVDPGGLANRYLGKLLSTGAIYQWTPKESSNGLFVLPGSFVRDMVNKVFAIKTINRCTDKERQANSWFSKIPSNEKADIKKGCRALYETGEVYDAYHNSNKFVDFDEGRLIKWKFPGINAPLINNTNQ